MNNFVLQHKMDKIKVEHEFHDMNDEGPVSFDMLQKGAKVRFFFLFC